MKNNIILGSVILILIVLAAGMGWMIYRDMDNRIAGLNSQISILQTEKATLQSQNYAAALSTSTQINQLNRDLNQSKNLKTFASIEDLRSFLANNAGYNFGSSAYDNSDTCIKMILAAKNQGYWMGLMPKQTVYYNQGFYNNNEDYNSYYDSNTPWIHDNGGTYRFFNNYISSSASYGAVVNVAVVNGRDIYTIESGVATYAGSMSTGFGF